MQDIKLAEWQPTGSDFLHRRLIFAPPRIRKGKPVECIAERLQDQLGLAGDTGTPIDQSSKNVKEQGLGSVIHHNRLACLGYMLSTNKVMPQCGNDAPACGDIALARCGNRLLFSGDLNRVN